MVVDHDKHMCRRTTQRTWRTTVVVVVVVWGEMQHLYLFTSALLPADDAPQRPSSVQSLQMSLMALSN